MLIEKCQLVPKLEDLVTPRQTLTILKLDEVLREDEVVVMNEPNFVTRVPLQHSEEGALELLIIKSEFFK